MPFEAYSDTLARADQEFATASADEGWVEWAARNATVPGNRAAIPPWWQAGAEYVFKVMKARIEDSVKAGRTEEEIRYMCRILTQAETSYIFGRVARFEHQVCKRADRNKRADAFAHYVNRSVGRRLAPLLRTATERGNDAKAGGEPRWVRTPD